MHDMHCHLDLYKDPAAVADATEKAKIFTVAVTNLPSAYYAAAPYMRPFNHLKLAVGLHPLLAEHHITKEKDLFRRALEQTDYVGEIGLDFSRQGVATKKTQLASFRFVLDLLQGQRKLTTIHSRRAESTVLDLITEFNIGPIIFHWYSGPLKILDQIIEHGHYFSVNPAMLRSANGRHIIDRIPPKRLLSETDGPFVTVNKSPAMPFDVSLVQEYLTTCWRLSSEDVRDQLDRNLMEYIRSCLDISLYNLGNIRRPIS